MKTLVRLRREDPLCPRIDLSLRGEVSLDEARSRLSAEQRSKILQLLSTPDSKRTTLERQVDLVASLIIRLERARVDRASRKARVNRVPRKTAVNPKSGKERKPKVLSVAGVELETTRQIRSVASALNAAMTQSVRVRNRIEAEMRSVRRSLATIEGDYLLDVVAACERAAARIRVSDGRDGSRALSSVVHQLASIWFKVKGVDPADAPTAKRGGLAFFNAVLDMAGVKNVDRNNLVRRAMAQRKERRGDPAESHSDQDEASDNSYPTLRRK